MRHLDFMGRMGQDGNWEVSPVPDNEKLQILPSLQHDVPIVYVRVRPDIGEMCGEHRKAEATHLEQLEQTGKVRLLTGKSTRHIPGVLRGVIECHHTSVGREPTAVTLRAAMIMLAHHPALIEECDAPGEAEGDGAALEAAHANTTTTAPPRRRRGA